MAKVEISVRFVDDNEKIVFFAQGGPEVTSMIPQKGTEVVIPVEGKEKPMKYVVGEIETTYKRRKLYNNPYEMVVEVQLENIFDRSSKMC